LTALRNGPPGAANFLLAPFALNSSNYLSQTADAPIS
jgi:hypothetical protein